MQHPANILVVDDDPDIGTMLKMLLEFKGYAVKLLNKAGDTEAVLQTQLIDLVILDMLISGTKGTDVCTEIRQNKNFEHLPILMISALPDARNICMEAGASEFISKPFEMDEILSKIKSLINTRQTVS